MNIPINNISHLRGPVRKFNIDDAVILERILMAKEPGHVDYLAKHGVNPTSIKREDILKLHKDRFRKENGELSKHGINWLNNALAAIFKRQDTKELSVKDFIKKYIERTKKGNTNTKIENRTQENVFKEYIPEMELQIKEAQAKIKDEMDINKKVELIDSWISNCNGLRDKKLIGVNTDKFWNSYAHEIVNAQARFRLNWLLEISENPTAEKVLSAADEMFFSVKEISAKYAKFLDNNLQGKKMKPVNLLQIALDSEKKYAQDKNVKIKVSNESILKSLSREDFQDSKRFQDFDLYDILSNLIHNGVKYTSKNSTINIEFLKQQIDGKNYLVFSVKDNGIGFPMNEVLDIFNFGKRASNAKASGIEGTGFGLRHVKGILDDMQNQASSTLGESLLKIESPITSSKKYPGSKVTAYIPLQQ